MEALECIKTRKSIRRFLDKEVSKDLVTEIIQSALRAPSYKNSQPWNITVVSGETREKLSQMLLFLLDKNVSPSSEIKEPEWPDFINDRIRANAKKRNEKFGISPTDQDALKRSKIANFNFYGAPVVIFISQPKSLGEWSILDAGMFIQNILLGFHAAGLGAVPQAYLTDYAFEVKKFLQIPISQKLILGISAGYPDNKSIMNEFISDRVYLSETLTWKD